jgi:serine phosphatase RsbU (regulator of sigma subunit)
MGVERYLLTDISAQKRVEAQLRDSNVRLEKRQNEMETELALAARIQQSLARTLNLIWQDLVIEAYFNPAHTIGGDFGVVHPQGDEFLNLVDAVRACRPVLLPKAQAAVEGIVAAAEALGLKSPHREYIKALNPGGAGQSSRSLPTKKPEFPD